MEIFLGNFGETEIDSPQYIYRWVSAIPRFARYIYKEGRAARRDEEALTGR